MVSEVHVAWPHPWGPVADKNGNTVGSMVKQSCSPRGRMEAKTEKAPFHNRALPPNLLKCEFFSRLISVNLVMRWEPFLPVIQSFQNTSPPPTPAIRTKPSTHELLRDSAHPNHNKGHFLKYYWRLLDRKRGLNHLTQKTYILCISSTLLISKNQHFFL